MYKIIHVVPGVLGSHPQRMELHCDTRSHGIRMLADQAFDLVTKGRPFSFSGDILRGPIGETWEMVRHAHSS